MADIRLIIPAHNEEGIIAKTLLSLIKMLYETGLRDRTEIVVCNNASTDRTGEIVKTFQEKYPYITCLDVLEKGKGQAIKKGFLSGAANVYAFMDSDLSTDISGFPALVYAIEHGSPMSVGSRRHERSIVKRSLFRSFVSWYYSHLLKKYFNISLTDFPCGFKAFSAPVIHDVIEDVENTGWFFDVELVVRAYKKGYTATELPVTWSEKGIDKKRVSKLNLFSDAYACFNEIRRLKQQLS